MEGIIPNKDAEKSFYLKEAYNTLRTNVLFCGSDVKTIAITSVQSHEGKSTVSWNLAYNLADSGKRVCLIDADMRKSVFSSEHGVQGHTFGLSEYLSGQKKLNEVLYATKNENLYVIMTGAFPPNPSELLSKPAMEDALKKLENSFDYVIIDTPPVGSVVDGIIVSRITDGTLFVIKSGQTEIWAAQNAAADIQKAGGKILGVILNQVNYVGKSKYYKSYYAKYE